MSDRDFIVRNRTSRRTRADDEPALVVDVEGYEGPLDLAAGAGAAAKGRPAQDFHSGAGRPVPRVHRSGPQDQARTRRRLSGDGGMARLSEVAAAAAGTRNADGPSAEEMATALANRLRRLEAIREASNRLMNRPQLERDIFRAAIRNRSPRSSTRIFPRRSTICSPPMPRSASSRRWPGCIWQGARCGR